MDDRPILRVPRAAVFAAVCVLLAAIGHTLASRTALPTATLAQAWSAVFAAAYFAAGRERRVGGIAAFLLAAQCALHPWFQAVQIQHPGARCVSAVQLSSGLNVPQMCGAAMPTWAVSTLTLGLYALVALMCAWWLRSGEAAVFALARAVLDRGHALIAFAALLGLTPAVAPQRPGRPHPDRRDARPSAAGVPLPAMRRGPPALRSAV